MNSVILVPEGERATSPQVWHNNIGDAPYLFFIVPTDSDDEIDGCASRSRKERPDTFANPTSFRLYLH